MTFREYFKDWAPFIPQQELLAILPRLNMLYEKKMVFPEYKNIFRAFNITPFKQLTTVFLGQDPYPQKDVATGILFGNNSSVNESDWSPSLKIVKDSLLSTNISYKSINFDPTLENWAKQGVLMLNSALTVECNNIGSHSLIWRPFIAKLLQNLSINNPSLIYVLFGNIAQSFSYYITKSNSIIKVKHPAYYASNHSLMPNVFREVNNRLIQINGDTIKWYG